MTVALPPNLDLWGGCRIRVTALDPTTGATVTTVKVDAVSLEVDNTGSGPLDFGPFMLVTGPGG